MKEYLDIVMCSLGPLGEECNRGLGTESLAWTHPTDIEKRREEKKKKKPRVKGTFYLKKMKR
ncbi:hypothetical protein MGYG_08359 [Nannizzia gypsea CBS 118893]|uniref:Uncharacterized protein n=1 Tax=Arthroderma gypseum (strain ATCC MYA-4604 / CBS 118893) TaxID=535722 RepID=E4V5H3_ARTGP|nr:hypothetical protein MGYG_08359 [Nannizzia gypsea CBS 118893]EFR05348.1 hypothetical protein MGYG_08359 [Nannizzia gypsea CBS 118893]